MLAQLPWNRRGPWDVLTRLNDPAFRVLNVSFHPDDIQNRPYADVRTLVPRGLEPDLFVAEMIEWHLIPPNVRTLGCPVLGHSSDFDLHIQTVAPWLELFDELVVLDHTEWRGLNGAVTVPVSVFPKVFGVPADLLGVSGGQRDIDVFLSGAVTHPYHIDKEAIVLDVLDVAGIRALMVQGFDSSDDYYRNLSRSKLCCTFIRHAGATPTRGLEALGMGCVVAVQDESVLRLFVPDQAGLVSYGPDRGSLASVIRNVLARSDDFLAQARRGAEFVRHEFALERVASQYLRFLTFLAARPRVARLGPPPERMLQKRPAVEKGWLPSNQFGGALLTNWATESAARIEERLLVEESVGLLNDLARERLLAHYHDGAGEGATWLADVVAPLERAITRFPWALVPRFNLIRALVHFGDAAQVRQGVGLLDDTLRKSTAQWHIDLLDDVLPWDFFPLLFNYRRYFDAVTQSLGTSSPRIEGLIAVILASLNHYRSSMPPRSSGSRYRNMIHGDEGACGSIQASRILVFRYCRLLVTRGERGDHWRPPHICNDWHHARRDNSRCSTSPGVCRKGSRTAGIANSRLVQSGCGSRHTIVNKPWNRSHAGRARSGVGARTITLPFPTFPSFWRGATATSAATSTNVYSLRRRTTTGCSRPLESTTSSCSSSGGLCPAGSFLAICCEPSFPRSHRG